MILSYLTPYTVASTQQAIYVSLLEKIKADQVGFRKKALQDQTGNTKIKASILTTLLGELETKYKKEGKYTSTSTQAVISKFIKNNKETMEVITDIHQYDQLESENETLSAYLPKQMTRVELTKAINKIVDTLGKVNMGTIMSNLRHSYQGTYDGKVASEIIKEMMRT